MSTEAGEVQSAIDWATTLASIDAALPGVSGVDLRIGTGLRRELAKMGSTYDGRFTPEVDAEKTTWLALASAAHDAADRTARYVESLVPDEEDPPTAEKPNGDYPGPSFAFDAYDDSAIRDRLTTAAGLTESATLRALLAAHRSGLNIGTPEGTQEYSAQQPVAPSLGRRSKTMPAVRTLELELVAKLAEANEWLAAVAYA